MGGGKLQSVCLHCGRVFKRIQELKRHMVDKRMVRRRCPFCMFRWSRPNNIKVHIISEHAEIFTAEILEASKGLRGRDVFFFFFFEFNFIVLSRRPSDLLREIIYMHETVFIVGKRRSV